MRIAIDGRVLSTEAANRGMGRYTQQQIKEVVKHDKNNEFLVICYPYFKKSLIDAEIFSAPNIRLINLSIPEIDNPYLTIPIEQTLSFSAKFQDFIYKEKIDLYHLTTPFINPIFSDFNVCPLICTLYDLIPLIFPKHYLQTPPGIDQQYCIALNLLRKSNRLISISNSARCDAQNYLGIDENIIDVAYPAVDPWFKVMTPDVINKHLENLKNRVDLPDQFILSVTGIHYSKNASTLFEAYQLLPQSLKNQLPLVVVLPSEYAYNTFLKSFRDLSNIIFIHSISDNELSALYNSTMMVVHPSRYEGFGYPVAEAMKCGAPVITTTSSSLPEVGGTTAILVEPENKIAFKDAIEMLINDPTRRQQMREQGLVEGERFNLNQLGKTTIESYQKSLSISINNKAPQKKHIAIWSSYPPLKCGVADYTAELSVNLSKCCDLEIFVDSDYLPKDYLAYSFDIHHFSAFQQRDREKPFDIVIYQMGSTLYQEFMYDMIRQHPGIIVFHDLIMGLGFYSIYNHLNKLGKFKNNILEVEGKDILFAYDQIIKAEQSEIIPKLDQFFRKNLLLKWLFENSLGQIVHMPYAKKELESNYSDTNIHVVPMGVNDPWNNSQVHHKKILRIKHGILPTTFVIGIFGSVVPVKRIESVIYAMQKLVMQIQDISLIIVGDQPNSYYLNHLQNIVTQLNLNKFVYFTGRTSREEFDDLFLACDVIINLRYPTYQGMSAILIRALAAGKPVIFTDLPEWVDFPSSFCFRVKPDDGEIDNIAHHLINFVENPQLIKLASVNAREYYEKNHTLEIMTTQYLDVINRLV